MSTTDMSARPAASSFSESVLAAGTRMFRSVGVDARVHRVRLEVERDRAARLGAAGVVAAAARQARQSQPDGKESAHGGEQYGRNMNATEVTEVQDRGPAAYIAEFIGTLLLVFFITAVVSLYVRSAERAEPESVHRLLGDRARPRLPAVRADPDARGDLRRALQPRGHRRDDRAAPDQAASTPRSTSSPSSPARVAGALLTKALLLDEGKAVNYGAPAVSARDRRRHASRHGGGGDRHLLPRLGDRGRGGEPARDEGVGRARDRRRARHGRDGVRAADRRRLQPRSRLRAGDRVRRVGRGGQLPARLRRSRP